MVEHFKSLTKGKADDDWGPYPDRGVLVSASDDCIAVLEGTLKTGLSKNGKKWSKWNNTSKTFYSVRGGSMRVYRKVQQGAVMRGNRRVRPWIMRDVTATVHRKPLDLNEEGVQFFFQHFDRLTGKQSDSVQHFSDRISHNIFPLTRENLWWQPVQGITPALRQESLRAMIEVALGKSRYRKDVARSLADSRNLTGLQVATAVKSLVPTDWLVPALNIRNITDIGPFEMRSLKGMFSRLTPNQRRLLLADIPNAELYDFWDSLRGFHNIPDGAELPRDTNWRDLHNTINPIARRFAGQRENVVIEQTGPSAKIDGLRIGDMVIQSAKETHELVDWGARMNHCIGSYGREAASGSSHLFALWNGENLVANLELTPAGDVRQFYGRFNATPPKEIVDPVRAAIAKKMKEK